MDRDDLAGARLWLVDDSALERDIIKRALDPRLVVVSFGDGPSMIEALAREERPDLLILDVEMPSMSGIEVCRFVREQVPASELPIVILTAGDEVLLEGLAAGANDYITKPFRPEELRARVATLVGLQRAHRKLFEAEQELRDEAAFRERFIGILAHDLRQPLATILFATQLIGQTESSGPASRARRAAMRMTRMIEELLDFTRSRSGGGMPVSRAEGDLVEIVRRVINDRQDKSSIVLRSEGNTRGLWDADRIAQLCGNLLGNARDYGAKDTPIHVCVVGSPKEVCLEVHNEGPAIPAADLSTLFDPFRRGSTAKAGSEGSEPSPDNTASRASSAQSLRHNGLGLGLYIVDQIVRAHGGSVNVRSGEDGTTFVARVPRAGS